MPPANTTLTGNIKVTVSTETLFQETLNALQGVAEDIRDDSVAAYNATLAYIKEIAPTLAIAVETLATALPDDKQTHVGTLKALKNGFASEALKNVENVTEATKRRIQAGAAQAIALITKIAIGAIASV